MKEEKDAVFLAELMVETGERMGKKMVALITDMDQPLGNCVGNALEVEECIEFCAVEGPDDLRDLCWNWRRGCSCWASTAKDVAEGKQLAVKLIAIGKALEKVPRVGGTTGR